MTYESYIAEAGNALITLVIISSAGAIFETLDEKNGSAGFMAGLCAAYCILGAIGKLIGLTG